MNESELETSLRRLQPVLPSTDLEERIAQALDKAAPRTLSTTPAAGVLPKSKTVRDTWMPAWLSGFGWAAVGAAVGVVAALNFAPGPRVAPSVAQNVPWQMGVPSVSATPASYSEFEPAESAREVVSSEDAGVLYDDDNQPARVVRYTSIERHTWLNPETGAQVEVEVPREDMVLEPVSYQ